MVFKCCFFLRKLKNKAIGVEAEGFRTTSQLSPHVNGPVSIYQACKHQKLGTFWVTFLSASLQKYCILVLLSLDTQEKVFHNLKHSHNAGLSVGEQIHTFNKTLPTALMIKANRYARALKACEERSSVQDSSSQAAKSHQVSYLSSSPLKTLVRLSRCLFQSLSTHLSILSPSPNAPSGF